MILKSNTQYQILTDTGWSDFHGIQTKKAKGTIVLFTDNNELECTHDHLVCSNNEFKPASKISVNDLIKTKNGDERIVSIKYFDTKECDVYDAVEVSNNNRYYTNDVLSHNCNFHGNSDTLVDSKVIIDMQAKNPLEINNNVKIYARPEPDKKYVMTVDVSYGANQDYSTFTIFDVGSKDQIFRTAAVFKSNKIAPLLFPDVIYKFAKMYNNAYVCIENNDQGAVVANALYYEIEYENMFVSSSTQANSVGIRMTNKVKRIGCSNMKELLENHKLELFDKDQISELMTFRAKGKSYEATSGNHDDLVMNIVLFSWFACTNMFEELYDTTLKDFLYTDTVISEEDDLVPVGVFNGIDNEQENEFGKGWQIVKD